MQIEPRNVDWEQIKRCLASIDQASRSFLQQAFLIGGAACWFYRNQLARADDRDFKVPALSAANESIWLSKDIDFAGIAGEELLAKLAVHVEGKEGRKFAVIEGVRIGYAQAGVTINPEEALTTARVAKITVDGRNVQFLVADPLTLFFEKSKLLQLRSHQNDWFHKSLLHDFICYELATGAERWLTNDQELDVADAKTILDSWLKVKNKAPEILTDPRLNHRLAQRFLPEHPISKLLSVN